MERNRSPVFVSCPAWVGAVLVAVAVWILPALAGAQQEYQFAPPPPPPRPEYQEVFVQQLWMMPPEVGQSTNAYGRELAWNVDTWLWPSIISPNVSFTQNFSFTGRLYNMPPPGAPPRGVSALMSLEQGTEGMRQASFTLLTASGARRSMIPGAECRTILSGGRTCAIPYDFRTDRWYLLRIWRLNDTSLGRWWGGWVIDDAGNESYIGSILAPRDDDLISRTWSSSRTSVAYTCGRFPPPSSVYFYQPILNNGRSLATISYPVVDDCSAGRVTPLWNGTLSQLELNYLGVSDAEYEVTIDDASFDRSESFVYDGEILWRYWIEVIATNTGIRALVPDFAGDFTGNPAFLFVTFYDENGNFLGESLSDVYMGVAPWNPGEQRRGSLWGTVLGHERSRVHSYVLYTYDQNEVACIWCGERLLQP